jgi:hypothetical protein
MRRPRTAVFDNLGQLSTERLALTSVRSELPKTFHTISIRTVTSNRIQISENKIGGLFEQKLADNDV